MNGICLPTSLFVIAGTCQEKGLCPVQQLSEKSLTYEVHLKHFPAGSLAMENRFFMRLLPFAVANGIADSLPMTVCGFVS